jgi:hypothetical protein
MKKFFDLATVTALVLAVAGMLHHFEMGKEMGDFLKVVVHKLAPWVNTAIYS